MNNGNDEAKALKEPGEVSRMMSDLNHTIDEVHKTVSELENTLEPITGPLDKSVDEPCPEEVMVPLATEIRETLRSVQVIQRRLNTLRSLIQL